MISQIFHDLGHEVVAEATTGEEAIEKYFSLKPDVVTMDVIMPKMHGIDALKEIIGSDPAAQIVIVSAVTHRHLIKKGLEFGALNFVTKPFTVEEFVNGISIAF